MRIIVNNLKKKSSNYLRKDSLSIFNSSSTNRLSNLHNKIKKIK